jgi:hypothetical protein
MQCGKLWAHFYFLNSFDSSDRSDQRKAGTTGKPKRPESRNYQKVRKTGKLEQPRKPERSGNPEWSPRQYIDERSILRGWAIRIVNTQRE